MSRSKCFVSSKCPVSCSAAVSDWLIQTFLSPLLPQSICHQQLAEVKRNKQTATEELVKSFQVEGFGKSNHWNIDTYWLLVWRFTCYISYTCFTTANTFTLCLSMPKSLFHYYCTLEGWRTMKRRGCFDRSCAARGKIVLRSKDCQYQ